MSPPKGRQATISCYPYRSAVFLRPGPRLCLPKGLWTRSGLNVSEGHWAAGRWAGPSSLQNRYNYSSSTCPVPNSKCHTLLCPFPSSHVSALSQQRPALQSTSKAFSPQKMSHPVAINFRRKSSISGEGFVLNDTLDFSTLYDWRTLT